jgi:hypothetical protein
MTITMLLILLSIVTIFYPSFTQIYGKSDKCDSSYPDVCISSPPDLNCSDISYKYIKVLKPDPHGFDKEGEGIGCESELPP